jgi:excinuclease ABC subunit C
MTRSALDGIPGLGEVRRKRLLRHFGSVKRVREATPEQLAEVPGLPRAVAQTVYDALHSNGSLSRPRERAPAAPDPDIVEPPAEQHAARGLPR